MVRTLLQRAENLITEEEDKNTEVDHIKKVLKANGYKTWMFNITQPMRRKKNTTTETSRRQHAIGLPYISKLSEQVARIFKSYNIPEENWHRRKKKEAINIHRKKPMLNRDVGQELPLVLLQLVSHDIGHVTHP